MKRQLSSWSFPTIKAGQSIVMNSPVNPGHMWYCLSVIGTSAVFFMSCGFFIVAFPLVI